ncbi:cellulose synthase subunit BcsC-related outer membrane protein [Chitiniphilus shinanonensis]|uniref:cellulose synthase subunit BcsC-related outer membrane protein n=1 Tax=Chitiniphilus shinanonensis TaxID=553088 RepID=UPI0030352C74
MTRAALFALGALCAAAATAAPQENLLREQRDGQMLDLLDSQHSPQSNTLDSQRRAQDALVAPQPSPSPTPPAASDQANGKPAPATAPDQRPLWRLLHARRLDQFDRALAQQQRAHPGWRPDAALLRERARLGRESEIAAALALQDADALRTVVAAAPQEFGCARIDRAWLAAEILARAGDQDGAWRIYRGLFPDCQPAKNRIATLYKAQPLLSPQRYAQLLELEIAEGRRDAASDAELARIRYERTVAGLADATPGDAATNATLVALAPQIIAYRDADTALLAGWSAHQSGAPEQAEQWFERARQWRPADAEAAYALAMLALERGDLDASEALIADPAIADDARLPALRARLAYARAVEANARGDYAASQAALAQAGADDTMAQDILRLRSWNALQLGDTGQAAHDFAALYRAEPSPEAAEGLALARQQRGELALLAREADELGGALADFNDALQAQRLYQRKLFLASHAALPAPQSLIPAAQRQAPPALDGIDSPSLVFAPGYEHRSGDAGLGRLEAWSGALRGESIRDRDALQVRYRHLWLDAGQAPDHGRLGTPGQRYAVAPDTRDQADELWLGVLREGWTSWRAGVGVTSGGDGPTSWEGQLAARQQMDSGWWELSLDAAPVRESLLSWRGMADPYRPGERWGAVQRQRLAGALFAQPAPRWGISAEARVERLPGDDVATNQGWGLGVALGYDLQHPDFDYLTIGPGVRYQHYRDNLGQFTRGHGGYYSPQQDWAVGIASQFLSREGLDTQWRGGVELGYGRSRQDAAPCFPLGAPAGVLCDDYAATTDQGLYASLQLAGAHRLSANWQVGGMLGANVSPGRDTQVAGLLFLRYFFEPRGAVFSRDLPGNARDLTFGLERR